MKNKNKKSINLLAIEVFLLLTATVLTTVIALSKNQNKKENESQQNQAEKETKILDIETINNEKTKKYDEPEKNKKDDHEDDENYDEENYKIENENLKKDNEKTYSENNEKNKKKDLVVIGSFETTIETEREKEKNRVHNIKTAAKFLDGVIVNPGCTFSFHRNTWDEGKNKEYKYADTLTQNGMDKGLGGGMCQVSSTLFVACLKTPGIEITKRQSHSQKVRYAPLGLDASYVTGAKDLEFKNTRKTPIKIKTYFKNNKLKIEIIGEEDEKYKNYKIILHPAKKEIDKKTKKMKTDVLVETLYKGESIKKKHFYSEYNID